MKKTVRDKRPEVARRSLMASTRRNEEDMQKVISYSGRRFDEGADPVTVAGELKMTPSNLSKIFKRFNLSPSRYYRLMDRRELEKTVRRRKNRAAKAKGERLDQLPDYMQKTIEYANQRFEKGEDPVTVARRLKMTPSNLSKTFKRAGLVQVRFYNLVPRKKPKKKASAKTVKRSLPKRGATSPAR